MSSSRGVCLSHFSKGQKSGIDQHVLDCLEAGEVERA